MNRTFCGNLQGQFVTAAYLFLDAAAGRIRYAVAGHPPMLCDVGRWAGYDRGRPSPRERRLQSLWWRLDSYE